MRENVRVLPRRDWLDMTWQDLAGADTGRWIAVQPVAAVEQHGPHLPLGTDVRIAEAYLAAARAILPDDLPVTFLPLQACGKSDEHLAFPGTLTLEPDTLTRVLTELGAGLARAGLRKLVLVSSHGGNSPVFDIVARTLRARHGMLAVTCAFARFGYPDGLFAADERVHGIHAGDVETSIMLAARPDAVRADRAADAVPATVAMERQFTWLRADRPAGFGWMAQDLHPSGAAGDATAATAEKGRAALAHGARGFVALLAEVHRFDPSWLGEGPLG